MAAKDPSTKRIKRVSSDNIVISFDLLSNLTYMGVLAAAQLPRDAIIRMAGEMSFLKTAVFFEQASLLAQRLGIEYVRALQMVAEKARAPNVKSLLLRFSNTIASGESEHAFIREEARIEGGRYANEYSRSVENLKKWTDAYAAMMVSVTLIVIVALVSTLLGSLDQRFVMIVGVTMVMIACAGVYLILRTAPYEQITYDGEGDGPPDRARAKFLLRTIVPIAAIAASFIYVLGDNLGLALVLIGVSLFPVGYLARRDDSRVRKIDEEVATFTRSLGAVAGATSSTLSSALNNINPASLGTLQPYIERLRTRLSHQMPNALSWQRFKEETGNELLRRSSDMLVDGVELGADAEECGEIASAYSTRVAELRELRALTANSFGFLIVPLHAAMSGLMLFILQIIITFNDQLTEVTSEIVGTPGGLSAVSGIPPGMNIFASQNLTLISSMITIVILVLTVSNALAAKFAAGGNNLKIASTLSTTCLVSGANMLLIPPVASRLLGGA